MAQSPPTDISSTIPADAQRGALETLSSELETQWALLDFVFENPHACMEELFADVLAKPPEERFTRCTGVLEDHVQMEFGSFDAFVDQTASANETERFTLLTRIFEKIRDALLHEIFHTRNPVDVLILVAAVEEILFAIENATDAAPNGQKERWLSTVLALVARLFTVMQSVSEEDTNENGKETDVHLQAIAKDVKWAMFIREEDAMNDPQKQTDSSILAEVRAYGAIIAYARLTISVSRGAQLADCQQSEFTEMLDDADIRPRYGPTAVDDMSVGDANE